MLVLRTKRMIPFLKIVSCICGFNFCKTYDLSCSFYFALFYPYDALVYVAFGCPSIFGNILACFSKLALSIILHALGWGWNLLLVSVRMEAVMKVVKTYKLCSLGLRTRSQIYAI